MIKIMLLTFQTPLSESFLLWIFSPSFVRVGLWDVFFFFNLMFHLHCLRYKSDCFCVVMINADMSVVHKAAGYLQQHLPALFPPPPGFIVWSQHLPSCCFRRIFGSCWKRGRITSTGCCLRTKGTPWHHHPSLYPQFVTFPARVCSLSALAKSRIQLESVSPKHVALWWPCSLSSVPPDDVKGPLVGISNIPLVVRHHHHLPSLHHPFSRTHSTGDHKLHPSVCV